MCCSKMRHRLTYWSAAIRTTQRALYPALFRKTFYDRFWKQIDTGAGVNDYEQNPTHYVSRYGANYFHEDIADTFAVFVLCQA